MKNKKSRRAYRNLLALTQELSVIGGAAELLHWDQEVNMPAKAIEFRSQAESYLAEQGHKKLTRKRTGKWIEAVQGQFADDPIKEANCREWGRAYERAAKIPSRLVGEVAAASGMAQVTWSEAKKTNDFSIFAPSLQLLVDLHKEAAECWGYEDVPYDALLEEYEPGLRTKALDRLFQELTDGVQKILQEVPQNPNLKDIRADYPIAAQAQLCQEIATAFGFDFQAGRIDVSAHPFCTTLGPEDVRLTTRYDERDFTDSLSSVLHETGHGLYEQGLPKKNFGTPCANSVSLGVHESQSRLWENHVGRSLDFWRCWHPRAVLYLPELAQFTPEELTQHMRRVRPSLIRVEADEVTYDLHVALRFEVERDLFSGELKVEDVPERWNARFKELFGIEVPDNAHGCLQDVHWAHASFGYFPTYSLGNLRAAQLMDAAAKQIPYLHEQLATGSYAPLLQWLRSNIHVHGQQFTPEELMKKATGETTDARFYLKYLRERYMHGQ